MLAFGVKLAIRVYERLYPDTLTVRKMQQARSKEAPALSGTMADCEVDENNVLTKRIRRELQESDLRDLKLVQFLVPSEMIGNLTKAAILEYDLLREAAMQKVFFELWKNDQIISVPEVLEGSDEKELRMEFVPWPRLSESPRSRIRLAVPELLRFLVMSIVNGNVVHGDISPFNVLLNPYDSRMYIIDYGLSSVSPALLTPNKNPAITISDAWHNEGFQFTLQWWDKQTWIDPSADSAVDACFVRSMMSLTYIACNCKYQVTSADGAMLDRLKAVKLQPKD